MNSRHLLPLLLVLSSLKLVGQADSTGSIHKKRLRTFVIGTSVAYTGAMIGLGELWYANSASQSFRFFDDNNEWKQVDKVGHFVASFYISNGTYKALRWTNLGNKKSIIAGAITGFAVMLPIEIFDGFSASYGASVGDLGANALGAAFFLFQQSRWGEIKLRPKYSYSPTHYAALRPELLGDTYASRILKDYNGQTYWLSVDMDKFVVFPSWLNLAVGYGANNMISADDHANQLAGFDPYRQYYIGLDLDLSAIRTRSKFLKSVFSVVNIIKLPAPAISFSRKGTTFLPLAF